MNIQTLLVPITHLGSVPHGYANGYVGVPKDHPWYGKDYDDIESNWNVNIHGGLTYSSIRNPSTKQSNPDIWWIGFDTAHLDDNEYSCSESYCQNEVQSLKDQAVKAVTVST